MELSAPHPISPPHQQKVKQDNMIENIKEFIELDKRIDAADAAGNTQEALRLRWEFGKLMLQLAESEV